MNSKRKEMKQMINSTILILLLSGGGVPQRGEGVGETIKYL